MLGELALIHWGHGAGRHRRSSTAVVKKKELTYLIDFDMLDGGGTDRLCRAELTVLVEVSGDHVIIAGARGGSHCGRH